MGEHRCFLFTWQGSVQWGWNTDKNKNKNKFYIIDLKFKWPLAYSTMNIMLYTLE